MPAKVRLKWPLQAEWSVHRGATMKIVVTGGSGFLGQMLVEALVKKGQLTSKTETSEDIQSIVLTDVQPGSFQNSKVKYVTGDITHKGFVQELLSEADSVFHLAGVVSGAAEADFDLGMRVNVEGTMNVLEACRSSKRTPKVVFSSSVTVYGGLAAQGTITDMTLLTPISSYGTQKAICEHLVNDYSRKGFIDGRSIRLPAVAVRPGRANAAASGFISSIIREGLDGIDIVCPVGSESALPCLSPNKSIDALLRSHDLSSKVFVGTRSILVNSLKVSVADAIAAVKRHAGQKKVGKVDFQINPMLQKMVDLSPKDIRSENFIKLGFQTNKDLDDIVNEYLNYLSQVAPGQ